jgi:hypothetical protein
MGKKKSACFGRNDVGGLWWVVLGRAWVEVVWIELSRLPPVRRGMRCLWKNQQSVSTRKVKEKQIPHRVQIANAIRNDILLFAVRGHVLPSVGDTNHGWMFHASL